MTRSLVAAVLVGGLVTGAELRADAVLSNPRPKVYIVPVRDEVATPLVYLVRRGVKSAMDAGAEALILDMETNGGRLSSTKEIIAILDEFKGLTVTYVNKDAYSAGAFIAVATQKIYMAPQAVIGAAAPILMSPGGGGVERLPDTLEAKMVSAVAARVRASAEKNGHNKQVVEAMINKTKELVIDGEVLNAEGNILTLTDREASKHYGDPPKPLLSLATIDSMDDLLAELGFAGAERIEIRPTGAERLASWINTISPILLLIGMVGVYLEFKTPGFGLPGIIGVTAFALYFLGGYVAGLSGMEWVAVFVVGLVLVGLELFLFPGVLVVGLTGAALILVSLVMAMVDLYPGGPVVPTMGQVKVPLGQILAAFMGAVVIAWGLGKLLPSTPLYGQLVSTAASGVTSVAHQARHHQAMLGQLGIALSPLRPGGKAQFGDSILDVVTQGEMVDRGRSVRVISHSATELVVEAADSAPPPSPSHASPASPA
jgi:membrane-bound serine protease (ClpP class)